MPDDKAHRNPEENKQIDINDPKEVASWCKSFGCSEGDLRVAVMSVGKLAHALKQYFNK